MSKTHSLFNSDHIHIAIMFIKTNSKKVCKNDSHDHDPKSC